MISEALRDGHQTIDGFTAASAGDLDRLICAKIAESVTGAADLTHHQQFGRWVGRREYDHPVEIFTTNYDLLIEGGLELAATPYFDGFVGHIAGQFREDLVDDEAAPEGLRLPHRWVRLWKLHGSVSWVKVAVDGVNTIYRSPAAALSHGEKSLAIYPSIQNFEESHRSPFHAFNDRLRRSLAIPGTLAIICGYSFGDKNINELLFDAVQYNDTCEIFAFSYDEIPSHVIPRALALPNLMLLGAREAVVGGRRGSWRSDPGDFEYSAYGHFRLGDYQVLVDFLSRGLARAAAPVNQ